jgi:hypothetical protein
MSGPSEKEESPPAFTATSELSAEQTSSTGDRLSWAFPWPITATIFEPHALALADTAGLGLRYHGDERLFGGAV